MISAIYQFALTTGANRVVKGARIEHVCGDPSLGPEKDYAFGMRIVTTALDAIASPVTGPTLFDPMRSAEPTTVPRSAEPTAVPRSAEPATVPRSAE
jgi:betaine reductase